MNHPNPSACPFPYDRHPDNRRETPWRWLDCPCPPFSFLPARRRARNATSPIFPLLTHSLTPARTHVLESPPVSNCNNKCCFGIQHFNRPYYANAAFGSDLWFISRLHMWLVKQHCSEFCICCCSVFKQITCAVADCQSHSYTF